MFSQVYKLQITNLLVIKILGDSHTRTIEPRHDKRSAPTMRSQAPGHPLALKKQKVAFF